MHPVENDAEALWFFGSLALIRADGDDYAIVEQLFPHGVETPLHVPSRRRCGCWT